VCEWGRGGEGAAHANLAAGRSLIVECHLGVFSKALRRLIMPSGTSTRVVLREYWGFFLPLSPAVSFQCHSFIIFTCRVLSIEPDIARRNRPLRLEGATSRCLFFFFFFFLGHQRIDKGHNLQLRQRKWAI
jgi:hypothetical protein